MGRILDLARWHADRSGRAAVTIVASGDTWHLVPSAVAERIGRLVAGSVAPEAAGRYLAPGIIDGEIRFTSRSKG